MNKIRHIDKCPLCGDELFIKGFGCKRCGTEVKGEFKRNKFSNLSPELLEFAEVFLLNEGNIKGVEETLGCSYPKVKSLQRELIKALGYEYKEKQEEYPSESGKRQKILDMLEEGKITAEAAAEMLGKF